MPVPRAAACAGRSRLAQLVRLRPKEVTMRTFRTALVVLAWVTVGIAASAQVTWRPAAEPQRTAAAAEWYQARADILIAGEWYHPAGPTRFFDPYAMVEVGSYDGVPLYADTTLEPHSVVYVPIGRGLLRPYERRRAGNLAGTVGSRTPSFPVHRDSEVAPPTRYWDYLQLPQRRPAERTADRETTVGTTGEGDRDRAAATSGVLQSARPPEGDWGIWVAHDGSRWVSDGRAVSLEPGHFERIGEYHGFDVFRSRIHPEDDVIYLPPVDGVVAPYRRSGELDGR
jgi:hypothetical protein